MSNDVEIIQDKGYKITASTKGYSVLEIQNKLIKHVDVEESKCDVNIERTLSLGKVIFKPLSSKPFTMYVTDSTSKTFPIRVTGSKWATPSLLTIKDKQYELLKRYKASNQYKQIKKTMSVLDLNSSRKDSIMSLIKIMNSGVQAKNIDTLDWNEEFFLWNEAKIIKKKEYRSGTLVGEKYTLTNISNSKMIIDEKEFYATVPKVAAVSIDSRVLLSGESTSVYLIKINGH